MTRVVSRCDSVSRRSRSFGYSGVSLVNSGRFRACSGSSPLTESSRTSALNFCRCGLALALRAHRAGDGVAAAQPVLAHLGERDVDVVRAGQVPGGADEGVRIEDVEDAGDRHQHVVVANLGLGRAVRGEAVAAGAAVAVAVAAAAATAAVALVVVVTPVVVVSCRLSALPVLVVPALVVTALLSGPGCRRPAGRRGSADRPGSGSRFCWPPVLVAGPDRRRGPGRRPVLLTTARGSARGPGRCGACSPAGAAARRCRRSRGRRAGPAGCADCRAGRRRPPVACRIVGAAGRRRAVRRRRSSVPPCSTGAPRTDDPRAGAARLGGRVGAGAPTGRRAAAPGRRCGRWWLVVAVSGSAVRDGRGRWPRGGGLA